MKNIRIFTVIHKHTFSPSFPIGWKSLFFGIKIAHKHRKKNRISRPRIVSGNPDFPASATNGRLFERSRHAGNVWQIFHIWRTFPFLFIYFFQRPEFICALKGKAYSATNIISHPRVYAHTSRNTKGH